jgi:hypothetical protein
VRLISPEDLVLERVLVSVYPHADEPAERCARKLIAVALSGQVEIDWQEVRRLAECPEYGILPMVRAATIDSGASTNIASMKTLREGEE